MFRSLFVAKGRVAKGDQSFFDVGSTTFTVPDNVFYISAVCVGGGGGGTGANVSGGEGGAGGDMVHATLPVVPGETLTVVVGAGGTRGTYRGGAAGHGGSSGIQRNSAYILKAKGGKGGAHGSTQDSNVIDDDALRSGENSGGAGGSGVVGMGGGGAAGYSGNGGDGGGGNLNPATNGAGGGGGGGAHSTFTNYIGGVGGGVHLFGEGTSGDAGLNQNGQFAGESGSVDTDKETPSYAVGYGGAAASFDNTGINGVAGFKGGVRIVWPGDSSFFPSSDVGAA
jgi:hypothetical protein